MVLLAFTHRTLNHIRAEFEKLNKSFAKLKQIVAKEGVPRLYIRALVELEDFLKRTNDDAEAKAKLSKINNKGFNTMKQRLKKNNAQFAADIEKYRQVCSNAGKHNRTRIFYQGT